MWKAIVNLFEIIPVIVFIACIVVSFCVAAIEANNWLKRREQNNKRHWRE